MTTAATAATGEAGLHDHVATLRGHGFRFFLVSRGQMLDHVDRAPYGIALEALPIERRHAEGWDPTTLLEAFNAMNCLAFGARGLPMPRWVLIDLAIMPSVLLIITVGRNVLSMAGGRQADSVIPALLDDADGRGLVDQIPVAAYCAAPSAEPGRWVGWSHCSVLPGRGLGTVVKALAVGAYRADHLDGVTQFDNTALAIHTRFGDLTVLSAQVPMHDAPGTFVYSSDLRNAADAMPTLLAKRDHTSVPEGTSFLLDPTDDAQQAAMNGRLLAGTARYSLLSPGWITVSGKRWVPIREHPVVRG